MEGIFFVLASHLMWPYHLYYYMEIKLYKCYSKTVWRGCDVDNGATTVWRAADTALWDTWHLWITQYIPLATSSYTDKI